MHRTEKRPEVTQDFQERPIPFTPSLPCGIWLGSCTNTDVISPCPVCRHTFSMNVSLYINRALTTSLSAALLAALMWLGRCGGKRECLLLHSCG